MNTKLLFSETTKITIATNTFINVQVILQYDDTPLIEVVRFEQAGFTTQIPIYHSDGTYLAKVVGSQLYLTQDGRKAGVTLEYPDKMTVCKIDGRVAFEIRREDAAALKTAAELFAPDGYFVRATDSGLGLLNSSGDAIQIGGLTMSGSTISGFRVGIKIDSKGRVAIGSN